MADIIRKTTTVDRYQGPIIGVTKMEEGVRDQSNLGRVKRLDCTDSIRRFIDQYDVFLLDCDGVLWIGDHVLPDIIETLAFLRSIGKQLVFVTNNSSKSRTAYLEKLTGMGITANYEEIFGSAYVTTMYLKQVAGMTEGQKVYVLGEAGIEEELAAQGLVYTGGTNLDECKPFDSDDYGSIKPDPSIAAVVCGIDRNMNYYRLAKAYTYLQNPSTLFVATNMDSTFPTHGRLFPGAGTTTSAPLIYALNGRTPVNCGKPGKIMLDCITSKLGFNREKACMVGDRLDTDIAFGINGGLGGTLLVLTGVTKEQDIIGDEKHAILPNCYVHAFGDLLKAKPLYN